MTDPDDKHENNFSPESTEGYQAKVARLVAEPSEVESERFRQVLISVRQMFEHATSIIDEALDKHRTP
jgi:hypothetical protein